MNALRLSVLACSLLATTLPAYALSLRDAARAALDNDPRVQASSSAIQASAAVVDGASAGFRPKIGFAGDIGRSDLRTDAPFPQSGPRNPNDASLNVSQPLYAGGGITALKEAADSSLDAARQSQRDVGGKIILATLTAYLDVLRDRNVIELSRSSLSTLEKAGSDVQKRFDVGEATRTDVAQSDARLAEARAGLRRAESQLRISSAAFRRLTARSTDGLVEQWPEPQVPQTLDEAIGLSAKAPFVLAAAASAHSSLAQVDFAGAEGRARVSLDGAASTSDNTEFGYERLSTWSVLLKLSVPIYQGGLIRAKVAEAEARAEQARYQAQDAKNQYAEAATREWESLQAEVEVIRAYESQVAAAESALDGVRKELDAGTRTTLDLLNAERELLASQVNLVASRRDRAVTAFRLLAACGELELEAIPE